MFSLPLQFVCVVCIYLPIMVSNKISMSNDINEPKSRSLTQMATRPPNVKIWWPEPIFSGQLQILGGKI
jgi:hypothetical protein